MKKFILIFGAIALLLVTARANSIVFDTFGPGDTYSQLAGYDVGAFFLTSVETAAQFTAGTSGNLATVDLGLTYGRSPGEFVNVYLYGDASGSPDNANQIFLGSGTPTALFGTTTNSVVSFAVAGTVPVTMGSTYWLVLKPDPANPVLEEWNASSPAVLGVIAGSTDDSTWGGAFSVLPAFRLTASSVSSVPDSGSTLLLMLGALVPLLFFQRTLIRRQASR